MDYEDYFERLETKHEDALQTAQQARQKRADPSDEVEIPVAKDMADQCEQILGQLIEVDGLAEQIRSYEDTDLDRAEIAIELADEIAHGNIGNYDNDERRVEAAIRVGIALLTEGVVAAPLVGITDVTIEERKGEDYIRITYAGPIRSAGGTAQALSVLIADYLRQELGIGEFKATDEEKERYVEEVDLCDTISGLQYNPKPKEIRTIIENCPIMIDGAHDKGREVDSYRDMDLFEGNAVRGSVGLVVGEGVALKAPKLQSYTDTMDIDGWDWLSKLKLASDDTSDDEDEDEEETEAETENNDEEDGLDFDEIANDPVEPNYKYMQDLTGGRPIYSYPQDEHGFRVVYGRARNTGHAATGVNPATMVLLNESIATGTQLKTEYPGKAAGMAPVDSIEGPTVRLDDGTVTRIDDVERAYDLQNEIDEIINIGEMLVPYGEFTENNHKLVPASFDPKWWELEARDQGMDVSGIDHDNVNFNQAKAFAEKHDIPLHPKYTYLWHDLDSEQYTRVSAAVDNSSFEDGQLVLGYNEELAYALESLLVPHVQNEDDGTIVVEDGHAKSLEYQTSIQAAQENDDVMDAVNAAAGVEVKERAPYRMGARMGRPEKSKPRPLDDKPINGLVPLGDEGGDERNLFQAVQEAKRNDDTLVEEKRGRGNKDDGPSTGTIEQGLAYRKCPECEKNRWKTRCEECDVRTEPVYVCHSCGIEIGLEDEACPSCGEHGEPWRTQEFPIADEVENALDEVGVRKSQLGVVKGVKGLSSESKIVEPIQKMLLRKKHGVNIYSDSTIRYDVQDLPLTSVVPENVESSAEEFREMGYEEDINGEPLEEDNQTVELKVQDVVINRDCAEFLYNTANFIDELLVEYYDMEPYYELDDVEDLIGEAALGLAPHTSAGVLCRVVGLTDAAAGYGHPYFHGAKRRNNDGDEDCFMLLLDGLLNYSEKYLNHNKLGWAMDRPLVMSTRVDPREIDDEPHEVEKVKEYDLDFYYATRVFAHPDDVDVKQGGDDLDELEGFYHTHDTSSIDAGPKRSSYKTIEGMRDKVESQLDLAEKSRSIDMNEVVEKMIDNHFIPDLKGNKRAFAQQEFYCRSCDRFSNERRIPLDGNCPYCGSELSMTVYPGNVDKFVDLVTEIMDRTGDDFDTYMRQSFESLEMELEELFEDETEEQSGLDEWM